MSSTAYALRPAFGLWSHHNHGIALLLDSASEEDTGRELLEVQIRSGDYFITLATILDDITQNLPADCDPIKPILERQILDLLYLQAHYRIDKKRDY